MNISDLILKKLTGQTSSGGGGGTTTPIGESSTSAYRGDRGKIAYDHSQQTGGNPHNITKEQVGLGNVNNTSDINKPISEATAIALSNKLDTNGFTVVKYAGSGDIASSYKLMVSGEQRGESIDIVKSLLVADAELLTCIEDGVPSPDFIVDDKYLDFVINIAGGTGDKHLYIKLTDLVDVYVGSNSILIDDNNIVSLKLDPSSSGLSITAGGLKLPLATDDLDGAMSATDKAYIDNLKNIGMDPPSMNQITDVDLISLATGDFMKFDGTKWVNIKPNAASGPVMLDGSGKIPADLGGGSGGGGTTTPIGETANSAYRGDRGKIAYDHSQQVAGNPHNITKEQVGLGNVDNTLDMDKPISSATAAALSDKLSNNEFTIVKYNESGSEEIAASYKLMVGGVQRGESIDIVKSLLVSDAALQTCTVDGTPSSDFVVGDKYLDFVVNVAGGTGDKHLYVKLTDLVDTYEGSEAINITDYNVSLKIDPASRGLSITAGGLKLPLATALVDGTMSATDKAYIDNLKVNGVSAPSMSQITDMNLVSLATNDFMKFNGTKWVNIKPNVASGPVMLDGSGKIPTNLGGGINKLADMIDVEITNVQANQTLAFNGTTWVNAKPQSGGGGGAVGTSTIFKALILLNAASWVPCTEDEPYQYKQIVTVTGCYDTDFALIDLKRTQNTIAGYQDEMNASFLITDFECEADAVTAYVFGDTPPQVDLTYRLLIIE